jgi:uncharacterized protein
MMKPFTTRRQFLNASVSSLAAIGLAARIGHAQDRPTGTYIDTHTHISEGFGAKESLVAKTLLDWMDRNDVAQAVVMPLVSPEAWDHPVSTAFVLDQTKPHRDRLIPFCAIDPRTINLGGYKGFKTLLERYRDAGAKGFGEHKPGVAMDDPRNMELFQACAEVGFPVLFHLDNNRNWDEPGLPGLTKVLETFPNGTFIGHAQGWWASISGDVTKPEMQQYPNKKVAPGGAIDALMDQYDNIYGDVSAGSGANAMLRDMDFAHDFVVRRADRLLFGTDYLAPGQAVPQFSLYNEMDLPEDVREKVFRGNARRILGL